MIESALWAALWIVIVLFGWWVILIAAFLFDWSARRAWIAMLLAALAAAKLWWDKR